MAYDHYGQFGDDADRGARDRDYDRNRSQNRSRNDEPGFFERAGEEIKSWFSDDDDQGRSRDPRDRTERDRNYRSQSGYGRDPNVNRYGERGAHNMGRGYEPERDRSSMSRGSSWDDRSSPYRSYGSSGSSSDRYSSADRGNEYGSQSSRYGTQDRQYGSRSGRSYGSNRDDDDSELLIYEEISGTLGGFGNQRFASSQDDHYRNWRDRQMAQLDQDYQDYCRECEQRFHSDFDSWRSQRQGQQSQSEMASGSGSGSSSRSSQDASSASRTTGQQSSGSSSTISGDRSKSTERSASKQPETTGSSSSRSGSDRSTS